MIKILILGDSNSPHILRWAKSLNNAGCKIDIFTLHVPDKNLYEDAPEIRLFTMNISRKIQRKNESNILKLVYFKAILRLKKLIQELNPDILHSHYASSYGLLGALAGFHPFIISVWGADIYNFPLKSLFHKIIIKYSLRNADKILSTSKAMAIHTKRFTKKNIEVTPFGIDINKFKPMKNESSNENDVIVIGTIKTLEKKYGVEYLIRAFKLVKEKFPELSLKLLIVGEGSLESNLKKIVNELQISESTEFTGFIKHDEIVKYHNKLDIYVSLSTEDSESFGVAVIEASSCEKPVVVSNVGGLPEVVINGETGFVVERENTRTAADAIAKLLENENLRKEMGKAGRQNVIKNFNWRDNINQMISIYKQFV